MEIKVYISQPYSRDDCQYLTEIKNILYGMVNTQKVTFNFLTTRRCLWTSTAFDDLVQDISKLAEADFVIFSKDWKHDNRCLIEHEIVVRYDIPHCEIGEIKTFFGNYIHSAFIFAIKKH